MNKLVPYMISTLAPSGIFENPMQQDVQAARLRRLARKSLPQMRQDSARVEALWQSGVLREMLAGVLERIRMWEREQYTNVCGAFSDLDEQGVAERQYYPCELESADALEYASKLGQSIGMAHAPSTQEREGVPKTDGSPYAPRRILDAGPGALVRALSCVWMNHTDQYLVYVPHAYSSPQYVLQQCLEHMALERARSGGSAQEQQAYTCAIEAVRDSVLLLQPAEPVTSWHDVQRFVASRVSLSHGTIGQPEMLMVNNVGDAHVHMYYLEHAHTDMVRQGTERRHVPAGSEQALVGTSVLDTVNVDDRALEREMHTANAVRYYDDSQAIAERDETLVSLSLAHMCRDNTQLCDKSVQWLVFCWPPAATRDSSVGRHTALPGGTLREQRESQERYESIASSIVLVVPEHTMRVSGSDSARVTVPTYVYRCTPEQVGARDERVHKWMESADRDAESTQLHWMVRAVKERTTGPKYTLWDHLSLHYHMYGELRRLVAQDALTQNARVLEPHVWFAVEQYLRKWSEAARGRAALWINSGMEEASLMFACMSANARVHDSEFQDGERQLMTHVCMLPCQQSRALHAAMVRDATLEHAWVHDENMSRRTGLTLPSQLAAHSVHSLHSEALERAMRDAYHRVSYDKLTDKQREQHRQSMREGMQQVVHEALQHCAQVEKEGKHVRLVVVNNRTYGAFGEYMALCVLDALDRHIPDADKRKRKSAREMWVCFTQDPLDAEQSTHNAWVRHARLTLDKEMFVPVRPASRDSQRPLALYRRMPRTEAADEIPVLSAREYVEQQQQEEQEQDAPEPARTSDAHPDAMAPTDSHKREPLHDASPVKAAAMPRARKHTLEQQVQALADALHERQRAFAQEIDARREQMSARPSELRRLDTLQKAVEQQTREDLQAVQDFLLARGGDFDQVDLYQPSASTVALNERVRVPRDQLASPQSLELLLVLDKKKRRVQSLLPGVPLLEPAPEQEPLVPAEQRGLAPGERVLEIVVAGPSESHRDEFLLYDDVIDGERSQQIVLLYMAAHNVLQHANSEDTKSKLAARTLSMRITREYARIQRGLEASRELERIRLGERTRSWLQNVLSSTNRALEQFQKNQPGQRETQAHLRRALLKCLAQERERCASLFVQARSARDQRRRTELKYLTHVYKATRHVKVSMHASEANADMRLAYKRMRQMGKSAVEFMKRVSEREVLGLQRLRTAYHLRVLVLHSCLSRYYQQVLGERNANTLAHNVRAASDERAHEIARTLAQLRVSDFLSRDVSNVARYLVLGEAPSDADQSLLPASPGARLALGSADSSQLVFGRQAHEQLFEYLSDLWRSDMEPERINSTAYQIERYVDDAFRYVSPARVRDQAESEPDVLLEGREEVESAVQKRERWESVLPTPVFEYVACNLFDDDQGVTRLSCNELDEHARVLYTALSEHVGTVVEHVREGRAVPQFGSVQCFQAYQELMRFVQQQQSATSAWHVLYERVQQVVEKDTQADRVRRAHKLMSKTLRVDARPEKHRDAKQALYRALSRYCLDTMHTFSVWTHFSALPESTALQTCLKHVSDASEALGTNQISSALRAFEVDTDHAWMPQFFGDLFDDNARSSQDLREQHMQLTALLLACAPSSKGRSQDEISKVQQAADLVMQAYLHTVAHVVNLVSSLVMQVMFQCALTGFVLGEPSERQPVATSALPHQVSAYAHRYALDLRSLDGLSLGGLAHAYAQRRETILYKREPAEKDRDRPRQNPPRHEMHARDQYLACCKRVAQGMDSVLELLDCAAIMCAFAGETCRTQDVLVRRERWVQRQHPEERVYVSDDRLQDQYRGVAHALAMSDAARMSAVRYLEYVGWGYVQVRAAFNTLKWALLQQEDGSFWDDRSALSWPDFFAQNIATPARHWLVRYDPNSALGVARTRSPSIRPHVWLSLQELVQRACHACLGAVINDVLGASVYQWECASGRDQWLSQARVLTIMLEHARLSDGQVSVREIVHDGVDLRIDAGTLLTPKDDEERAIIQQYSVQARDDEQESSYTNGNEPYMTALSLAYPTVPVEELHLGTLNDVFVASAAPQWLEGRMNYHEYAQLMQGAPASALDPLTTQTYATLMQEYERRSTPVRPSDVRKRRRASPTGITPPGKEQAQHSALSLPLDIMLAGALQSQLNSECGASSVASMLAMADFLDVSQDKLLREAQREVHRDISAVRDLSHGASEPLDLLDQALDQDDAFLRGQEPDLYTALAMDPDDAAQMTDRLRALVSHRAGEEAQAQTLLGSLPKTVQNFEQSWQARRPDAAYMLDVLRERLHGPLYGARLQDPELLRDMARPSSTLPQTLALEASLYKGVEQDELDRFREILREYIRAP